ncbi:hypothetical protein BH23BAC1_BH23BAC1_22590 [soil metagenome]
MRDFEVRKFIKDTYLKKYSEDKNSLVVEEVNLYSGASRIDIAVFNCALHAYEIKSDKDTLSRLPSQINYYSKVFEFISVICGSKHYEKIKSLLPSYIGLIVVTKEKKHFCYKLIRKPKKNSFQQVKWILDLLWKEELKLVIEQLEIVKGLSSKSKKIQIEAAASYLDTETASQYVRDLIKMRQNWRVDEQQTQYGDLY